MVPPLLCVSTDHTLLNDLSLQLWGCTPVGSLSGHCFINRSTTSLLAIDTIPNLTDQQQ